MANPAHDTPEWREQRDEKLKVWIADEPAIEFLIEFGTFAELLDDLVDGDKAVSDREIVGLAFTTFVRLPNNPFFQHFGQSISPAIVTGINAWLDSNIYARGDSLDHRIRAYMLRTFYCEIVNLIVYLLHGQDRMRELSMEIREFFQAETFEDYLRTLPTMLPEE